MLVIYVGIDILRELDVLLLGDKLHKVVVLSLALIEIISFKCVLMQENVRWDFHERVSMICLVRLIKSSHLVTAERLDQSSF